MKQYQKIPRSIQCPVCFASSTQLLWVAKSEQAAQHFVLKEKDPERFLALVSHIEHLWGRNTCEIIQCGNCEFCFSHPYIAGDERFYTLAYERTGYPSWKWEFEMTFNLLIESKIPDCTLLEIGAGNGAFVKKILGVILPKENILCTEYSEYGKKEIEGLGIKCLSVDVRELHNESFQESFNVVCMFQVLEHLDRLSELFQQLNWLLKNGGSLFIAVPNPIKIEFNELNGALLDMPPNHVGRWNKKCFEEIGKLNGFYIKVHKIENSSFFSMATQFVLYRFYQRSQKKDSLENQIQKIKNRYLLRIMQVFGLVVNFFIAIPALTKINSQMGSSQWVHFIKDETIYKFNH